MQSAFLLQFCQPGFICSSASFLDSVLPATPGTMLLPCSCCQQYYFITVRLQLQHFQQLTALEAVSQKPYLTCSKLHHCSLLPADSQLVYN